MSLPKMIKEANELADKLIDQQKHSSKVVRAMAKFYAWSVQPVITINKGWLVTIIFLLLQFVFVPMANATCTSTTDSWGNTRYNCGGTSGTMTTDSWGTTRDSRTGTTYKTDAWGTTRGSDGSSWKTDSWGTTRYNDGTTSKTDAWGTTRFSDGTSCKTDTWGTTRCN